MNGRKGDFLFASARAGQLLRNENYLSAVPWLRHSNHAMIYRKREAFGFPFGRDSTERGFSVASGSWRRYKSIKFRSARRISTGSSRSSASIGRREIPQTGQPSRGQVSRDGWHTGLIYRTWIIISLSTGSGAPWPTNQQLEPTSLAPPSCRARVTQRGPTGMQKCAPTKDYRDLARSRHLGPAP